MFGWKVRQRGDGNLAFDDTGCVSGVGQSDRTPDERTRHHHGGRHHGHARRDSRGRRQGPPPAHRIGPKMGAFATFLDQLATSSGLYEGPAK
jgi:hypothetical protein